MTGRVALVTGGSRGIGFAIAERITCAGGQVVITGRRAADLDEAARQLGDGCHGVVAHAADAEAARQAVHTTLERFGRLDYLVNNAGTNPYFGPLLGLDSACAEKTFSVNQWAPVLWCQEAVREWMGEHGGVILNVASAGGVLVEPGLGFYNATKAALIHLTRQLAAELGPGVRVNALAPGVVKTSFARALWEDHEEDRAEALPLRRLGVPGDVAGPAAFLLSDAASWITGETLVVDGGWSIVA